MEFEDVNQKIEREAQRVAAAFGVDEIEDIFSADAEGTQIIYVGQAGSKEVCWGIDISTITANYFKVADEVFYVMLFAISPEGQDRQWSLSTYPKCHHALVRGLYCLGVEDEGVLTELNVPLSAHERLELRLSMPREFWPQKWIDEESGTRKE